MTYTLINTLIFTLICFILIITIRSVFLLFWRVQRLRKTWLWYYIDYIKFYTRFKFRWWLLGSNSLPKENAKALHFSFSNPEGRGYNHRFSKKAAKVVKDYIEEVF